MDGGRRSIAEVGECGAAAPSEADDAGGLGALGAGLGFVITLVFFVGGQLAVDRVLRGNPQVALGTALPLATQAPMSPGA